MNWVLLMILLVLVSCELSLDGSRSTIKNTTETDGTVLSVDNSAVLMNDLVEKLQTRLPEYTENYTLAISDTTRCSGCYHTWPVNETKEKTSVVVTRGKIMELIREKQWTKGTACNGACSHPTIRFTSKLNAKTNQLCSIRHGSNLSVYPGFFNHELTTASQSCSDFNETDIDSYLKLFFYEQSQSHNWTIISENHNEKGHCFVALAGKITNTLCFEESTNLLSYADWIHRTYYELVAGAKESKRTHIIRFEKVKLISNVRENKRTQYIRFGKVSP